MSFGDAYANLYDEIYADKDYSKEVSQVIEIFETHKISSSARVLDVGMGTGRHSQLLLGSKPQLQITGIEPSPSMAARAAERGLRVLCDTAALGMQGLNSCSLESVLALFHVACYFTKEGELDDFLGESWRVLEPGGLLIFDVWHAPAVEALGLEVRIKRIPRIGGGEIIRVAEPKLAAKSTAEVRYHIFFRDQGSKVFNYETETHRLRYFRELEIQNLAFRNGFSLESAVQTSTNKEPSQDTWSVTYVLKRLS